MTIEQALRELSRINATISFRSHDRTASIEISARGFRVGWAYDPMMEVTCNLSVLSWKIVMLTRALKRKFFMANVTQRLKELFDCQHRAGLAATVSDLIQFAQIVDDELDRLEASRQDKPQDGRKLVDDWGQTETKD